MDHSYFHFFLDFPPTSQNGGPPLGILRYYDPQTELRMQGCKVSIFTHLALGLLEFVPLTKKMTTSTAVKIEITVIETKTTTAIWVCISVEINDRWQRSFSTVNLRK